MAPFRLPFTSKKPITTNGAVDPLSDENARSADGSSKERPSLALGLKERREEPNEFKLSSVNDCGEYLPPSPTEKKSFWHKSPSTTSTSAHRSVLNDTEPFSISRESFDSYRRSFDISGRSPIVSADSYTSRTSLDSRASRLPPRSSLSGQAFERPPVAETDEGFEEVGLHDDPVHKPKKKSFLSRFGESTDENTTTTGDGKSHHFHILPGRKRGQSGTGSELGSVQRPESKGKAESVVR